MLYCMVWWQRYDKYFSFVFFLRIICVTFVLRAFGIISDGDCAGGWVLFLFVWWYALFDVSLQTKCDKWKIYERLVGFG